MTKKELLSIWKMLDKGCDAIERLEEEGLHNDDGVLFSNVVSLKNKVEENINNRTREGSKDPFE